MQDEPERFVGLKQIVAEDFQRDGLARFTGAEGDGAVGGRVVIARERGHVGRVEADRAGVEGRAGANHGDGDVGRVRAIHLGHAVRGGREGDDGRVVGVDGHGEIRDGGQRGVGRRAQAHEEVFLVLRQRVIDHGDGEGVRGHAGSEGEQSVGADVIAARQRGGVGREVIHGDGGVRHASADDGEGDEVGILRDDDVRADEAHVADVVIRDVGGGIAEVERAHRRIAQGDEEGFGTFS